MYWLWGQVGKRNRLLNSICLLCQGENFSPNKELPGTSQLWWVWGSRRVRSGLASWACDWCTQKASAFEVQCFAVTVLRFSVVLPCSLVLSVRSGETVVHVLSEWLLASCVLASNPFSNFGSQHLVPWHPWWRAFLSPPHSITAATLHLQQGLGCGGRRTRCAYPHGVHSVGDFGQ